MSLSRECSYCPFDQDRGFEIPNNRLLGVCGDPSQRCINLRGKLRERLEVWDRLSMLAEVSKRGTLHTDFLQTGDMIDILSSEPGKAYGDSLDRRMIVQVTGREGTDLHGIVRDDSYNEAEITDDKALWAVPERSTVVLHGAFLVEAAKSGKSEVVPGELHVGRYVSYTPQDHNQRWGMYVQEIVVRDPKQLVAVRLFATDPAIHRPAPSLE